MKTKKMRDIFSFLNEHLIFKKNTGDSISIHELDSFDNLGHLDLESVDVLVLEDDKDMSDLLVNFFKQNHLNVLCLTRPEDAIKYLSLYHPFLVTLDLGFQGSASGGLFLEHMKTIKTDQKPWVAVVSSANEKEVDAALLEGGDFYFSKPVDFNSLQILVDRFYSRRKSA